eukprot:Nk52_evm44s164 gene=Nk52_evmTU44s164
MDKGKQIRSEQTNKNELTSFDPLSPEQSDSRLFSLTTIFGLGRTYSPNDSVILGSGKDASIGEGSSTSSAGQRIDNDTSIEPSELLPQQPENVAGGSTELKSSSSILTRMAYDTYSELDVRNRTNSAQKLIPPKRTITTVLKRLKTIGDQSKVSKQFWMPDSNCKECYDCGATFSTFKRKHHCRICGQIFCWKCCNEYVDGGIFGRSGDLRVCNYCLNVVKKYSEGSEGGDSTRPSSMVSEEDTTQSAGLKKGKHKKGVSSVASFASDSFSRLGSYSPQVLNGVVINRNLSKKLQDQSSGLAVKDHRDRLTTFENSFVASELVDTLVLTNRAPNRRIATDIGQAMLDAGLIEHVSFDEVIFRDEYALFRFNNEETSRNLILKEGNENDEEQSSAGYSSGLKHSTSDSALFKLGSRESLLLPLGEANIMNLSYEQLAALSSNEEDNETNAGHNAMSKLHSQILKSRHRRLEKAHEHLNNIRCALQQGSAAGKDASKKCVFEGSGFNALDTESREDLNSRSEKHVRRMLNQLLSKGGLGAEWCDVIFGLILRVCENVSPNIRMGDSIDIREYVKIKKIPGGHMQSSDYVSGVAFTKNVAHKKMARKVANPRILILSCAIEYQRIENQLASFDPLVLQEREYLRILVSKIAFYKPDILVVEKTVSRIAQELLLEAGITLLLNVKPKMMKSISRCTGAEILVSLDKLNLNPVLGTCGSFYVSSFKSAELQPGKRNTLVYFEGCPPQLGCTLTLRGASLSDLAKVKNITRFMIHILHGCRLENAFIVDEYAVYVNGQAENPDCISPPVTNSGENAIHKLYTKAATQFYDAFINVCLSCTFSVRYPMPYLYTREGIDAPSREYVSDVLYWSSALSENDIASKEMRADFRVMKGKLIEQHLVKQKMETGKLEKVLGKSAPAPGRRTVHKSDSSIALSPARLKEHIEAGVSPMLSSSSQGNEESEISNDPFNQFTGKAEKIDKIRLEMSDCLCPEAHQSIRILFSSHSSSSPTPCVPPRLITIAYYGENDMTLGQYLDNFCFNSSFPCSDANCTEPMTRHSRSYIHGMARVNVGMEEFRAAIPEFKDVMLMWSWCKRCRQVTPVVPMSNETWCMSFAKFLELSFYGSSYVCRNETCSHLLHRDHVRYFGFQQLTVHFEYDEIDLLEIVVPSRHLKRTDWTMEMDIWRKGISSVKEKFRIMYSEIFENLMALESKLNSSGVDSGADVQNGLEQLSDVKMRHTKEKVVFLEKFKQVKSRIDRILSPERASHLSSKIGLKIVKDINVLKVWLSAAERAWQIIFENISQEFVTNDKPKRNVRALSVPLPFSSVNGGMIRRMPEIEEVKIDDKDSEVPAKVVEKEKKMSISSIGSTERDVAFDPEGIPIFSGPVCSVVRPNLGSSPTKGTSLHSGGMERKSSDSFRRLRGMSRSYSSGALPNPVIDVKRSDSICSEYESLQDLPYIVSMESLKGDSNRRPIHISKSDGDVYGLSEDVIDDDLKDVKDVNDNLDSITQFMVDARSEDSNSTYDSSEFIFFQDEDASEEAKIKEEEESDDVITCEPRLSTSPEKSIGFYKASVSRQASISSRNSDTSSAPKYDDLLNVRTHTGDVLTLPVGRGQSFSGENGGERSAQSLLNTVDNIVKEHKNSIQVDADKVVKPLEGGTGLSAGFASLSASPPAKDSMMTIPENGPYPSFQGISPSSSNANISGKEKETSSLSEKKDAWVKTFTNFFPGSSNDQVSVTIAAPFPPEEHYSFSMDSHSVVYINEKEPSTIVAWALGSSQYWDYIKTGHLSGVSSQMDDGEEIALQGRNVDRSSEIQAGQRSEEEVMDVFFDGPKIYCEDKSILHSVELEETHAEIAPLKVERERDFLCEFSDGRTNFMCRVYYASEFAKLRSLCLEGSEDAFLLSLSKSMKWQTTGGKSGSAFSKMADDRFIMKEMSRLEVQSFLDFGNEYFEYTMNNIRTKQPSVLAKILGVYRISFKNGRSTGRHMQHVLVMENLFYGRKISRIFDLKGSMRSRYVQSSGNGNDVLMDENLLEFIYESPLFLRPHSKTVLKRCIWNDTLFLCNLQVMDYSLLVGIDETNKQLVIGIIDYIRTFTWDKKLETWVKSTGILGGHGKMPTVTSPEFYKYRFRDAMEKYFMMVPDKWTTMGLDSQL